MRIVIELDGGLVRHLAADQEGVEALILDFDLDGAGPDTDERIHVIEQYGEAAMVTAHDVVCAPDLVADAFAKTALRADLLTALQRLLDVIEYDGLIPESVSYMREARAAVARAEGMHPQRRGQRRPDSRRPRPGGPLI